MVFHHLIKTTRPLSSTLIRKRDLNLPVICIGVMLSFDTEKRIQDMGFWITMIVFFTQ